MISSIVWRLAYQESRLAITCCIEIWRIKNHILISRTVWDFLINNRILIRKISIEHVISSTVWRLAYQESRLKFTYYCMAIFLSGILCWDNVLYGDFLIKDHVSSSYSDGDFLIKNHVLRLHTVWRVAYQESLLELTCWWRFSYQESHLEFTYCMEFAYQESHLGFTYCMEILLISRIASWDHILYEGLRIKNRVLKLYIKSCVLRICELGSLIQSYMLIISPPSLKLHE